MGPVRFRLPSLTPHATLIAFEPVLLLLVTGLAMCLFIVEAFATGLETDVSAAMRAFIKHA